MRHLIAVLGEQDRNGAWLARKTGVSPSYVSKMIRGERRATDPFKKAAAEALGVPVSLLFPPREEAA